MTSLLVTLLAWVIWGFSFCTEQMGRRHMAGICCNHHLGHNLGTNPQFRSPYRRVTKWWIFNYLAGFSSILEESVVTTTSVTTVGRKCDGFSIGSFSLLGGGALSGGLSPSGASHCLDFLTAASFDCQTVESFSLL